MIFKLNHAVYLFCIFIALAIGIIFPNSILGLLITLGFGVYAFLNPKSAFISLFLYFTVRPFLTEINPSLKAVGDIIIFAALLKIVVLNRKDWKSLFSFQWFELGFFAFCLVGALSAYLTGVSIVAIVFQLRAFLLMYLVFYIVRRMDIDKEDVYRFFWTVLTVAILLCVHGLAEKITLRGMFIPVSWQNTPLSATNRIRIYGLTGNPNALAIYLSFAYLLVFYFKNQLDQRLKWIMYVSMVLILGVWILTYSRGAWLGLLISLILYMFLSKNWRILKTFFVSLIAAVILVSIPANLITNAVKSTEFGKNRVQVQSKFDQEQGSFSNRITGTLDSSSIQESLQAGRLYIVEKGLQIFPDHPIIGTGFGTFGDSASLSHPSPIYNKYHIDLQFYADNQYIEIFVEAGILGVLLFAVFLLNMLYRIWKRRGDSFLMPIMFSVLLATYLAGGYYNIWENNIYTLFYFTLLGCLFNFYKFPKPSQEYR